MKVKGQKSDFERVQLDDDFYMCTISKIELRENPNAKGEKRYFLVWCEVQATKLEPETLVFPMSMTPTSDAKNKHGKLIAAIYGKFEEGKEYETDDYIGRIVNILWVWDEKTQRMVPTVFKKA